MKQYTFQDIINEIDKTIINYSAFKIGKTGQKPEERFKEYQPNSFNEIIEIGNSEDKEEINEIERKLIEHYRYNNKCENQQTGGGEMVDSFKYYIYLVVR